jgi:hypothetical protein
MILRQRLTMLLKASLGALTAFVLVGCALGPGVGGGPVETRTVPVNGVTEVTFEGVGDLEIIQGEAESLEIRAQAGLLEAVTTEVRGNRLYISLRRESWRTNVRALQEIHYRLVVPDLTQVTLAGAGAIRISQLRTEQLRLDLDGAGDIHIDDMRVDSFTVRHRGAGSIDAKGEVGMQTVRVAGAGSYRAEGLDSLRARIEIAGAGDAIVSVQEHLDARIYGVGSIRYHGDPKLEQRVLGVGQIKRIGSR